MKAKRVWVDVTGGILFSAGLIGLTRIVLHFDADLEWIVSVSACALLVALGGRDELESSRDGTSGEWNDRPGKRTAEHAADERDAGTPYSRWLDGWLKPRWRALLTLVAFAVPCSVLATITRGLPDFGVIDSAANFISAQWPANLFPVRWTFGPFAMNSWTMFLLCWFQPLCLRLSLWRSLLWIGASTILAGVLSVTEPWHGLNQDLGSGVIIWGHVFGLPGLAVIGARSRPWMSFAGSALAIIFLVQFRFSGLTWVGLIGLIATSNLLYGAVMLYGTDPLPKVTSKRLAP